MNDITFYIKSELLSHGADLVGVGSLEEIPSENRYKMPVGICVAVKYPKEVIRGIYNLPTKEYNDYYHSINEKLDMLVTFGAETLKKEGYEAIAQTKRSVVHSKESLATMLPHKTVATRAGLGWIGKSALLVTREFGSMIRISTILTNAPLKTEEPVNISECGECMICTKECPAGAVSGKNWSVKTHRDDFFDAHKCQKTAKERALKGFGIETSVCGKCIVCCPYTQRYLNEK